ncbi:MAG: transcription antitermination factor NusB [Desulfobacterales bacterium]
MKNRRKARERALQALFYMDIRQDMSREAMDLYCQCFPLSQNTAEFFQMLAQGVMRNRDQIDSIIARFSDNWKISRMSCVDRNIMRVAVYEMFYCEDIPFKVSINEAIDIGKKYGTEESGAFINGILDRIHIALENKEILPENDSLAILPHKSPGRMSPPLTEDKPDPVSFSRVRGHTGIVKRRSPVSSSLRSHITRSDENGNQKGVFE